MQIEALVPVLRTFVAERDWGQFHDPKNLSMLLASEAGELLAEYRWVRNDESDAASMKPELRARVTAEIGDVGIALLLLCDRIGVDLGEAMAAKLELNRRKYPAEAVRGRADRPSNT
jgi:NTP pyrophosphatase (non-canonical NTP hydrolase)